MRARPAKLPPIRVLRERIDAETDAIIAFCFKVARTRFYDRKQGWMMRPHLYGLSMFTLCPSHRYADVALAEGRLRDTIRDRHGGRLPGIGFCADLPGWADYDG